MTPTSTTTPTTTPTTTLVSALPEALGSPGSLGPDALDEAVTGLRNALAPFGSPGPLGPDELLDAVTALDELQEVLDAVELLIAGELESRSRVL